METLKEEITTQDFLTVVTKVRWGRMVMEPDEILRCKDIEILEEEDKIVEMVFLENREFKEENKNIDL